MTNGITRRDFMNGVAMAIVGTYGLEPAGAAPAEALLGAAPAYPPAQSGLRGSHVGSFEAAHRLRDGKPFDLTGASIKEHYDLVVVGGGISGLASAHFYKKHRPGARILILDTNDDFGGHAKRNEFHVDGKLIIGYGGTQSIDSPKHKWGRVARGLLQDLGIDVRRFNADFDQAFYPRWALQHAVFFKKEVFGSDRLVRRPFGKWGEFDENPTDESTLRHYLDQMPLSERARAQLFEMYWSGRDVLAGRTAAQRREILQHTSYSDFLRRYWNADDDVLKFLQTRTHELWATGIDAVPASETMSYPGLKAQRLALGGQGDEEEPYIYHFPDGNASIARMLVRKMIPDIAPGHTMDDIVLAPFDYAALDRPGQSVRIRLNSTAVDVRNAAKGVEIAYVNGGSVCSRRGARLHLGLLSRDDPLHCAGSVRDPTRGLARERARAAGLRKCRRSQLAALAQARRRLY